MIEHMFATMNPMLEPAHEALATIDPIGRTRSELCDQIQALARLESHLAERRLAVTAAIDALDDDGVDGVGVNRSVGRCSGRRARQLVDTATVLTEMPALREALADGLLTVEHADAAARAAVDVDLLRADTDLTPLATQLPADLFAKKAREWVGVNENLVDGPAMARRRRPRRLARPGAQRRSAPLRRPTRARQRTS